MFQPLSCKVPPLPSARDKRCLQQKSKDEHSMDVMSCGAGIVSRLCPQPSALQLMQQAGTLPAMLSLAQVLSKCTDSGKSRAVPDPALDQPHLAVKVGPCIAFCTASSQIVPLRAMSKLTVLLLLLFIGLLSIGSELPQAQQDFMSRDRACAIAEICRSESCHCLTAIHPQMLSAGRTWPPNACQWPILLVKRDAVHSSAAHPSKLIRNVPVSCKQWQGIGNIYLTQTSQTVSAELC